MDSLFEYALLAFTSLFTMVNPIGFIPLFVSLTQSLSAKEAKKVALKAVFVAFTVMMVFAFTGQFIFNFFQISVNSLRVVGGIIFFINGYDMLQAKFLRTKDSQESNKDYVNDIAITPLAIPIICGPGVITISIVMMNDAQSISHIITLIAVIILILLITFLFAIGGRKILSMIGESGNKVLIRIMGLIVMVIAVEFLFSGLKPILRDIFLLTK